MPSPENFPRVLFITSHAFNHSNGGGVTFSNLFSGWPKDRLACVHNDPLPPETDVCERYFRLGTKELGKWGPFSLLQREPLAIATARQPEPKTRGATSPISSRLFTGVRSLLFGTNEFPETAFLSPELEAWIENFSPQVLYTILGSNGLMDLIELIRVRFRLPLVVHIMDDWRATSHVGGLLGPLRRKKMQHHLSDFMAIADHRMGISDAMCEAYEAEYGRPFETFHNAIDTEGESTAPIRRRPADGPFKIFYGGAVLPFAQLQSIIDVCQATASLVDRGMPVRFDIFSPPAMTGPHRESLLTCDAVKLHPPMPRRQDYLSAMRNADLLLLPVNFSDETIRFIRYSMPTKVPELMQSGVPTLVYGPCGVAQVDYASGYGWGYTVTERGVGNVVAAIEKISTQEPLRDRLTDRARRLVGERHNIDRVRAQFRAVLADAAIR
ncbi:MAG TPA: hypothetical protein ENI69_10480 [Rhodospirillales bacterium]|nr:hypothetical protein [Rhodospirillales bacterium]